MSSPSSVSRSTGMSSVFTNRRSDSRNRRSSSGSSKSISCSLLSVSPQDPHVDRNRSGGADHQRIDLHIGDAGPVIEIELRERERGLFERRPVGGGAPAIAGQEL